MTVFQAIHRMRALTARGQTFAVSFMTYSRERRTSHGVAAIEHASVVKNPVGGAAASAYQDHMLTLRDHDTLRAVHIWQPLLLSLDHQPLESID